jgi:AAA15 family ATPase/GTPase
MKLHQDNSSSDTSNLMRIIHLHLDNKDVFDELKSLMGSYGLNLIDNISVMTHVLDNENENENETGKPDTIYFVRFKMKNGTVSYDQLSFGTQHVISILLSILYDNTSVLLIEQPEDGIHVGLLRKLIPLCIQYILAHGKQLFITTHSTDVIDILQPENLKLVSMTESGTKVNTLCSEDMCHIKDFIKDEGTLSEFIDTIEE